MKRAQVLVEDHLMPWVSEAMFWTGWVTSRTSGRDKCESSDVTSTTDTPCWTECAVGSGHVSLAIRSYWWLIWCLNYVTETVYWIHHILVTYRDCIAVILYSWTAVQFVRPEAPMEGNVKTGRQGVSPCSSVDRSQGFGVICCPHHQDVRVKMERQQVTAEC
jgi:hypothetical protein